MSLFIRVPDLACKTRSHSPLVQFLDDYSQHASPAAPILTKKMGSSTDFTPPVDVRELATAFEIHMDLSGVDKNDINVQLTGADILKISGHKERRYITRIEEETEEAVSESSSDDGDWQALADSVESIDSATMGPSSRQRRTSLVDVSRWRATGEHIDASTSVHMEEKRRRRPSVTNARAWEQPLQVIDAAAHHDAVHKHTTRRQSITDARNWQKPVENIDTSFTAPQRKPTVVAKVDGAVAVPESIDAATTYSPRNPAGIYTPRPRQSSFKKSQYQPWLLSERPFGTFSREFKFPRPVERTGIKASFKDGVLTVVVQKRSSEHAQQIPISVE